MRSTTFTKHHRPIVIMALFVLAIVAFMWAPAPQTASANPNLPRTVAVHLFEWKWSDIAKECETFLGPKGFAAVQVSPPNEHINHKLLTGSSQYAWWARYQPVTFSLTNMTSRSGTRAEFDNMVQRCAAVGVDIYVDAVINHMADQVGQGVTGTPFNRSTLSYPAFSAPNFHSACIIQGSDYSLSGDPNTDAARRNNVWNCQLSGLPDLKTEDEYVRAQIAAYLQGLVNSGVKGFRIDAAKHMNPADIQNILSRVTGNYYVYQEVIDPGGQPVNAGMYTHISDVLEFKYSQKIGETFNRGQLSWLSNFGEAWGFMANDKAVVFVDNHDNQRGHGMAAEVTHKSGALYDLANVYMLAWPYGYPVLMSSYEWGTNDSAGPPHDGSGNTKNVHNADGTVNCFANEWKCEHRWRPIANMVTFRNYASSVNAHSVTNWWTNGANQIAFTRSGANGGAGFVVINREGNSLSRTFQTGLPAGTYCNIIAGDFNHTNGTCSGSTITVNSAGSATITVAAMSSAAIHRGAIVGGGTPVPTATATATVPPTCSAQMNLRGTNNAWGNTAMTLSNSSTCTWSVTTSFGSTSTERFKFDVFGNWATNYGDNNNDGIAELSGGDIAITQGAGSYTITFRESNKAYTITKNSSATPTPVPPTATPVPPTPTATPSGGSVTVQFTVNGYVTQVGQDMYVVGSAAELGSWNTANAVKLNWVDSDTWSGPVVFTTNKCTTVQFKFIVKQGSTITWQSGNNRTYAVPCSGSGSTTHNWQ